MSLRTTNSGYGKEFYENGKVRYEGEWTNGEWNGNGKQFDEDGKLRYEGGFQNNEWHGKGKNFDEDGKLVYDGEWKNGNIGMRIKQIKTHQNFVHKNYKKCAHCEKINTFIISGCKSKHKLCSECIYDKTECPVCNEDLGLQHCDICYEYKKGLVDTGCENKHQTCKDCLYKIIEKNNAFERVVCPFCRGYCSYGSKEPVDPHPDSYYLMDNGEDYRDYLQDMADDRRER